MGRSTNINHPFAPAVAPPVYAREHFTLSAVAAKTASFNSTAVDFLAANGGFENAQVLLITGVVSGTTPTMDVVVQESDDNSTFTSVSLLETSDPYVQVTVTTNLQRFRFKRTKRYVRISVTIAGTTPSFTMGAVLIR